MVAVEFINRSTYSECYRCKGKGCSICNGTGQYKKNNYILVYTDKNGQKMAFQTDGIK